MKSVSLFLLTVTFLFVASQTSFACSCKFPTTADALTKAEAVFDGRIIAIESDGVRFKVEKSWKGTNASQIKVYVRLVGTSCDPGIKKGRRFIVYANAGTQRIPLIASYCGRTKPLEYADEDLKALNERAPALSHAKPNNRLQLTRCHDTSHAR